MPKTEKSVSKPRRRESASLLSPQAMGGVLARRGMAFQDLWLIQMVTGWASDPSFRGFVNEGTEDVEASWFSDEKPPKVISKRWQMKDRQIDCASSVTSLREASCSGSATVPAASSPAERQTRHT